MATTSQNPKFRIGVDVGGTNTDAVIIRSNAEAEVDRGIVAWAKSATTSDVTDGISAALSQVLEKAKPNADDILYISIGTTHFLNALIEADSRRLSRVAVLRLGAPYTAQCPPFVDFPTPLRNIIEGHSAILDGGLEIDGKEIKPINPEQIRRECEIIRGKGLKNVVIVGVFSPLASSGTQEEYVKKIIEEELEHNVNVVCSKDVGHIGLLERENAAILNASILTFAQTTVRSYQRVLKLLGLKCPLYLTQLDGTLISAPLAAATPIRTFSNGPTNSMRGASYLAGLHSRKTESSTIVIDVGGTTTDVGVLLPSGFPRKAASVTYVGGVRTSFSMPDIHSIGLGGGSRVHTSPLGKLSIGPDSVGHAITQRALVFGGDVLTATDLASAAGLPGTSVIGDPTKANSALSPSQVNAGIQQIKKMLEMCIDKMKTDPSDITVLLVGGGSVIVPEQLNGVKEILRPPFFDVANAVGAAIAGVAAVIDRIEIPEKETIADVLERCKADARLNSITLGADPETVRIAEVDVIQLPYVVNRASRVIIKAYGELDVEAMQSLVINDYDALDHQRDIIGVEEKAADSQTSKNTTLVEEPAVVDITSYIPNISPDGVWKLSEVDLAWIAEGCAVLGCGGGGATYPAFLVAREALRNGKEIRVVDHTYFKDRPLAWLQPCGFMGSPSVSSERIPSGNEVPQACSNLHKYLRVESFAALISDEIGGKNGLEPMLLSAKLGSEYPVIDGDLMGRAYPRLDQIIPCIYKENGLWPVAAADGVGNTMIVPSARNNIVVEDMLRAACTALGSSIALAISPIQVRDFEDLAIIGTTSQAWWIGRAIEACRRSSTITRVAEAITSIQDGKLLFVGKIVEVQREVRGGFTRGSITIAPLMADEIEGSTSAGNCRETDRLMIPFQNENLHAYVRGDDGSIKTLCSVPDLIVVLDSRNGSSIGTQDYRYGLQVTVIGLACDPRWTTPDGLNIGGPQAFGLDIPYVPIGKYSIPRSVVQEYRQRTSTN